MNFKTTLDIKSYFLIAGIFCIWSLFISSCGSSSSALNANSGAAINLDWLLGDWTRINEQKGRITYEHWKKENDQLYIGLGVTIESSGDTVFREDLKIMPVKDGWAMIVKGVNEMPTTFLMREIKESLFSVQNLENEFPKYIEYSKVGKQLSARVYNDEENVINFEFKKLDE